jgi:hypothetical protein
MVSDVGSFEKWAPDASDAKQTSEGDFGMGSTFSLKYSMSGKTYDISGSVTAYEPPNRLGLQMVGGPMPMDEIVALEPAGDGTRISQTVDVRPKNLVLGVLFTQVNPLMGPMFKKQIRKELRALKQYVESE